MRYIKNSEKKLNAKNALRIVYHKIVKKFIQVFDILFYTIILFRILYTIILFKFILFRITVV